MPATIDLQQSPHVQLSELVNSAKLNGEVQVLDGSSIVARLLPVRPTPPKRYHRKAGSARGQFVVPDDFKAPLEDFKDYM